MQELKRLIEGVCDRFGVAPVAPTFMIGGGLMGIATISGQLAPILFVLGLGFIALVWRLFGPAFWP